MEPVKVISGPVTKLNRADVDTDQIIPKQFLKRIERTGFGEFLFYDWAQEDGWSLPKNPILATGANFGCGSSREHAPWALQDYGFKAIAEAGECQVDLAAQEVRWPTGTASFEIDPETKHRLLNGLDDIDLTLQKADEITSYEGSRERPGPVTLNL